MGASPVVTMVVSILSHGHDDWMISGILRGKGTPMTFRKPLETSGNLHIDPAHFITFHIHPGVIQFSSNARQLSGTCNSHPFGPLRLQQNLHLKSADDFLNFFGRWEDFKNGNKYGFCYPKINLTMKNHKISPTSMTVWPLNGCSKAVRASMFSTMNFPGCSEVRWNCEQSEGKLSPSSNMSPQNEVNRMFMKIK